jgi:hypothetical protein
MDRGVNRRIKSADGDDTGSAYGVSPRMTMERVAQSEGTPL